MKFHPAAEVFPLLSGKEFTALVADIKEHGQIDPILVLDGMVLDGRNRWRACKEAGVEPKLKDWTGGNPWDFVWSKNAERRHLEPGQKAAIRYKVEKGSDAWLAKQEAAEDKANRARSEAATEQHKMSNPRKGEKSGAPSREGTPKGKHSTHAARALAESSHTSRATSERVISLEKKAPELFEKVCSGELKLGGACREAKRNESSERLKGFALPTSADGPFGVIVADPPWTYDKRAEDDTHRGACPYPCMSLDAIKAIEIPATDDAILWLWTTNAHLEHAFGICRAWGFEPKTVLTWIKQKMGLGDWLRGKSEHCLLAVRGRPTVVLTNQTTVLEANVGEHSAKPSEFYAMVEKLCPDTRRLELFSRCRRDGWYCSGCDL